MATAEFGESTLTKRITLFLSVATACSLILTGCAELAEQGRLKNEQAAEPVDAARSTPGSAAGTRTAPNLAKVDTAETSSPDRPNEQIITGTDSFVGRPASIQGGGVGGREGDITLNFVNADVREVVRSVLGDILGENYVLDARVQGSITVETSRPLARGALLPMLEQILQINGFALVRKPDNFLILPMQDAINTAGYSGSFLPSGGVTRGFAIAIVPLKYVSAEEMDRILQPLAPNGGVLRVDAARNLLVMAGTQQEMRALHELVEIFDVDWMAGMSFAMMPLDYASAATVIGELDLIFGTGESGALDGMVRFIPVERINAVLVIARRAHFLADAKSWIDRLDQGESQSAQRRLFVYYVKNGRSEDLADILTEVFADNGGSIEASLAPGAVPAIVRSDIVRPVVDTQDGAEPASTELPTATPSPDTLGGGVRGIGLVDESDIRIIADATNNSLVVMATPREYRMIEAALTKLDIVPLQVLIEATVAEVTLTDSLSHGVQWFLNEGSSNFSFSDAATGVATASVFPGFTYLLSAGTDFRLVIKALEEITDVNIISSPQLMVLDNHSAELQVGDDVPIATQEQQASTSGDAPLVNTIEFRETGIILRVTPRVNPGGLVLMDIVQEVSTVTSTTSTVTPTIQQRRIESSIAIQSGETVALGGLIQDNRTQAKSGVPFLHTLPLIGNLFGATSDDATRTELLIVITPRVVGNPEEARAVTQELRDTMRAVIPLNQRIDGLENPPPQASE